MNHNIDLRLTDEAIDNSQEDSSIDGMDRFLQYVKNFVSLDKKNYLRIYPGLQAKPWHEPQNFSFSVKLESSYKLIKQELLNLRNEKGFQPEKQSIERVGSWNVYFLYEGGKKNEENCSRCPETTNIIESISSMRTLGGLIYFSATTPGTHIKPHRGHTNFRLRCHLGLDISENCGIKVGSETRTWKEGKCLLFDDSFLHESWNYGERTRIVLVVDVWHPDLTDIEIQALKGLRKNINYRAEELFQYWKNNEIGRAEIRENSWWI